MSAGRRAAVASRRGVREYNMDAGEVFEASTGVVAAAVVDGIGNDRDGADTMRELARIATRVGAIKGALAGILTAAAYIEDPGTTGCRPNAVMVLALSDPAESTMQLGWVGDSHAYTWNGTALERHTDPHTMGAFLRWNGDIDLAPSHDNWVRTSLTNATAITVALSEAPADELLLLVSDGLDSVPLGDLEALVKRHQDEPRLLADAIVNTARADQEGYRDDATAVVLTPPGSVSA
jgi:serine/threonine protein phosphatase PrpC